MQFPPKQRMDLGECPKIHDLALRADFEKAQQAKDYFYDLDVSCPTPKKQIRCLQQLSQTGYGTSASVHR